MLSFPLEEQRFPRANDSLKISPDPNRSRQFQSFHVKRVDEQAQAHGTIGIVSTGWDPGLFSMNRLLGEIVVPQGETTTFWGEGLSQGHSEAVRRVDGVKDAVQYTVPIEEQLQRARTNQGAHPDAAKRHKRVCYVVAEE